MPWSPKFIDRAKIFVKSGGGGDGSASFRREKFLPNGGPDGGDGGKGGDVVIRGSKQVTTLIDLTYRVHHRAEDGKPGARSQRTGRNGTDHEIVVPCGTLILDDETGRTLGEILEESDRIIVARGGRGGLGNLHFKSSTNRAPVQTTPGGDAEERWIRLELRLLADIGIIGPPNAGKSTLISVLTAARPKIADYPFTTLSPALGVFRTDSRSITLADIPGLIEGAHDGAGLGTQFLRHIERTAALIYVVAIDPESATNAFSEYVKTRTELEHYNAPLSERKSVVVLNKCDLLGTEELLSHRQPFLEHQIDPIIISAKMELGLDELKRRIVALVS